MENNYFHKLQYLSVGLVYAPLRRSYSVTVTDKLYSPNALKIVQLNRPAVRFYYAAFQYRKKNIFLFFFFKRLFQCENYFSVPFVAGQKIKGCAINFR